MRSRSARVSDPAARRPKVSPPPVHQTIPLKGTRKRRPQVSPWLWRPAVSLSARVGDPRTTGRTKRRLNAKSALCKNRGKHAVFATAYEY